MVWTRPTYRLVDGERVDGAWRHVWVKGLMGYYVDDLFAYADGLLRCGETFDLQGLRQRLESGTLALSDPEQPVPARPEPTPRWSARYPEPLTDDGFVGEAADEVLEYFNAGDRGVRREGEHRVVLHADDPVKAGAPAITLHERGNPPTEPPERPGLWALRNEFPAPFTYGGHTYPTIIHGYWANAAADRSDHDRIRDATTAREAHESGGRCILRPDWAVVRTAVMADLLRAKFAQHPELAGMLLSTGDARISYTGISESPFWTDRGPREGRNWSGRLLELIRAELLTSNE